MHAIRLTACRSDPVDKNAAPSRRHAVTGAYQSHPSFRFGNSGGANSLSGKRLALASSDGRRGVQERKVFSH